MMFTRLSVSGSSVKVISWGSTLISSGSTSAAVPFRVTFTSARYTPGLRCVSRFTTPRRPPRGWGRSHSSAPAQRDADRLGIRRGDGEPGRRAHVQRDAEEALRQRGDPMEEKEDHRRGEADHLDRAGRQGGSARLRRVAPSSRDLLAALVGSAPLGRAAGSSSPAFHLGQAAEL